MNDKPIPAPLDALVDNYIAVARVLLVRDGKLQALAFVGNTDQNDIYPIEMEAQGSKDEAAAHVRKVAAMSGANFIFTIHEAWMLGMEHARNHAAIVERYGSIGESPYGIEAVFFQLETKAGTWSGTAVQKPIAAGSKRKTFGEVKMERYDGTGGRFSNLLPQTKQ